MNVTVHIDTLRAGLVPVAPDDVMSIAGRKIMRKQWIAVLLHESGSRTGEDVEDVHEMRVAIRRIRCALRLLSPYYKPSLVRAFKGQLQQLAWSLGAVRDLDVLIDDVSAYQTRIGSEARAALQPAVDRLNERRQQARGELNHHLDGRSHRRFVKDFGQFLMSPEDLETPLELAEVTPTQVQHLLPVLIYQRLAAVRAYQPVLATADAVTRHALRIKLKQLRYALELFVDVLTHDINEYVDEIKKLQDFLGKMNDAHTARDYLSQMFADNRIAPMTEYIEGLAQKEAALEMRVMEYWDKFNTRKVQGKLSKIILTLH